jgi:hypothetical protein
MQRLALVTDCSFGNSMMDFLVFEIVAGYSPSIRVMLLTLCPTLHRDMSRDILISGVDGIVLVVDSRVGALSKNISAMREVDESKALSRAGNGGSAPLIVQYNKRDVNDRLPLQYLQSRLNPMNCPWVASVAGDGRGVLSTLRIALSAALEWRGLQMKRAVGYGK